MVKLGMLGTELFQDLPEPSAVLRWGGFLDTVEEGASGIFFEAPASDNVANAVQPVRGRASDEKAIRAHAAKFSEERFIERMRAIVQEEAS